MDFLERFWSKVDKTNGCWIWKAAKSHAGYGVIRNNKMTLYAHRTAWELTNKKELGELHMCHSCDNPGCVNPIHLFAGTHTDNMRDMFAKGRKSIGEEHPLAVVTIDQVKHIWELREQGLKHQEIADIVGIHKQNVTNILTNRMWNHVKVDASQEQILTAWLERLLVSAKSRSELTRQVGTFKKMWTRQFGNLDNVPTELKEKTDATFQKLKESDSITSRRKGSIWEPCNRYYKEYQEKQKRLRSN